MIVETMMPWFMVTVMEMYESWVNWLTLLLGTGLAQHIFELSAPATPSLFTQGGRANEGNATCAHGRLSWPKQL